MQSTGSGCREKPADVGEILFMRSASRANRIESSVSTQYAIPKAANTENQVLNATWMLWLCKARLQNKHAIIQIYCQPYADTEVLV